MNQTLGGRQRAWELLCEHTRSESLRAHALAVECVMRALASKYGEDEETWGITGLLHDLDYERHPSTEEHPYVGVRVLEGHGYPEEVRRAVLSHAGYTGVERLTLMEKALHAADELSGFLTACALVQPNRKMSEVRVASVKKKLKSTSFARGVDRDAVRRGAEELGVELDVHIAFCIEALCRMEEDPGL